MFDRALHEARVGLARKARPVDVRPARPGDAIMRSPDDFADAYRIAAAALACTYEIVRPAR
jgi:hypothetical protein